MGWRVKGLFNGAMLTWGRRNEKEARALCRGAVRELRGQLLQQTQGFGSRTKVRHDAVQEAGQ